MTPGQTAYVAYYQFHARRGLSVEAWDDLEESEQAAWEAGAQAVIDSLAVVDKTEKP